MSGGQRRERSGVDRRSFLGAVPAAMLGGRDLLADTVAGGARLATYGVQLYTLREEMAADPERTLASVAEIGYGEVEFAGLHGLSAREMRAVLDRLGLRAASSHHSVGDVRERWAETLDGARELGQALVVVPSIPSAERTPDGLRRLADEFNRAGEAARGAGLRFGYHNHDWEHRPLTDGTVPMDLLLRRTDRSLVDWQMDIFWTVHGGADPLRYLRRVRGRVTSVHVKDRTVAGEMVDVGDGVIDFYGILTLASELGLMHAFVEHDRPVGAVRSARRSLAHLRSLGPIGGKRP